MENLSNLAVGISAIYKTSQGKLHETGSGYTFYWMGYPEKHAREYGVGFAVSDSVRKPFTDKPIGITPES